MIVISFTPSYSLLAYLFQSLGTVLYHFFTLFYHVLNNISLFFQHIFHLKMLSLSNKIFSSF